MGRAIVAIAGYGLAGLVIGVTTSIVLFRQTTMTDVLSGFAVTLGATLIGSAIGWLIASRASS